jgi:hypothetical protein
VCVTHVLDALNNADNVDRRPERAAVPAPQQPDLEAAVSQAVDLRFWGAGASQFAACEAQSKHRAAAAA